MTDRTVGIIGLGIMKRVHPATDLGADHDVIARHAPERRPAAMFGEPPAVERRGVEQVDAELEGPLCRGDGGCVVEEREEIAKRRCSEAENRDLEPGPPKHAAQQASGPLPGPAGVSCFTFVCQSSPLAAM